MANVMMPQKKKDNTQQLLTIAGGVAGGVLGAGNPAAISTGANIGGMIGGAVGPQEKPSPLIDSNPMTRRLEQLDQNPSPLRQIRDSVDSLQYIKDPAMRDQLAQPLLQASVAAKLKPRV